MSKYSIWTDKEKQLLIKGVADGLNNDELCKIIGRPISGIKSMKSKLGLVENNKWTADEKQLLIDGFEKGLSDQEISILLKRKIRSVKDMRNKLGLSNYNKNWTNADKQLLIDGYYNGMTVSQLAEMIQKSEASIRGMKTSLGLNMFFNPLTEDDKKQIKQYYLDHIGLPLDLQSFSKNIGRPIVSIERYARKLGLTDKSRPFSENGFSEKSKLMKGYQTSIEYARKLSYYNSEKHKEYYKSDFYKEHIRPIVSQKVSDYWRQFGHPKGMLGKHHSDDTRKRMSKTHIELAKAMSWEEKHIIAMKGVHTKRQLGITFTCAQNAYSRCKGGYREDLNHFFRSSWEANVARILNYLKIEWIYEFKRFYFENGDDGVMSYLPDFYLPQFDVWIEVKGWMDDMSKTRLKKFKDEYPEESEKLMLICEKQYYALQRKYNSLNHWESKGNYVR